VRCGRYGLSTVVWCSSRVSIPLAAAWAPPVAV